jgi:hypothetical protein
MKTNEELIAGLPCYDLPDTTIPIRRNMVHQIIAELSMASKKPYPEDYTQVKPGFECVDGIREKLVFLVKQAEAIAALQPSGDDDGITCKCGVVIPIGSEVCYNCEMLANSGDVVSVPRGDLEALIFGADALLGTPLRKPYWPAHARLKAALSQPSTVSDGKEEKHEHRWESESGDFRFGPYACICGARRE